MNNPMMPVITMIVMGFALNLYNKKSEMLKIIIAWKFKAVILGLSLDEPKKAINTMVNPDEAINPIDDARRPFKMFEILLMFLCFLKKLNNMIDNTVPNKMEPMVAIIAPIMPAILMPTNVDVFMAKGPGVI